MLSWATWSQRSGLGEVWGKKYNLGRQLSDAKTEALVEHQLDLDHISNTSFIQIGVYADDPNEAATLANAIARRYCDVRTVEFRRAAAENKHLVNSVESYGVVMMDPAVPRWRPVRPGYIAELMLIVGAGLTLAGGVARIIAHNYSGISSYFSEMYNDTP
jgi:capsular polysaccharide biosynthesis protein